MTNNISEKLPQFSTIVPEDIVSDVTRLLHDNREKLKKLLMQSEKLTWDNLLFPIEEMNDVLSKMWAPISHLHAVSQNEVLREAYRICQPLLTEYHTDLLQNEALYQAVQSIAARPDFSLLDEAKRKVIENELRDFKLTGVHLPLDKKMRFAELQKKLSHLTTQFSENVLDATNAWSLPITDIEKLRGIPEQNLQIAAQNAEQHKKSGWLLTLEYPCFSAVMKHAVNRELRRIVYEAYFTRASEQGPYAGKWDNSIVMQDIMTVRQEIAQLLGFSHYADYSLATKMAATSDRVLDFLDKLVEKSKPIAKKEIKELEQFAKEIDSLEKLEAWDIAFYSEKYREQKFALTQEELQPYFPMPKVLAGLFEIVRRLYGIHVMEKTDMDTWNASVQCFAIKDVKNNLRGYFYTDFYSRPHKRDGAWMDECQVRRQLADHSIQYPIAFLTCNFARPVDDKPALLTHDDVQTLFHEFGHGLHHLLTQVNEPAVSGINGVLWDAVEFPSQFMEHWCWEKEALALISEHVETKAVLPDDLYAKLIATKHFHAGLQMLRQLEFSLFDFKLHMEFNASKNTAIQSILDSVRLQACVIPPPSFNRFQHTFSHIFSGGYAAGYYSYKWAEVLSSDAFSLFEEKGIFDATTGQSFLKNILEQGGVKHPMDLFIAFRGREPKIDALLKECGLERSI